MNEKPAADSAEFPIVDAANQSFEGPAPGGPKETKTKSNQGIFGKLLKRAGRHPKGCDCGKCEWSKKAENPFSAAPLPDAPISDSESVPEFAVDNGARFAFWGRLAARLAQAAFSLLTVELPAKASRVFGAARGAELVAGIEIKPDDLIRLESSAAAVAKKYNISTKYDEELELAADLGAIFGPLLLTLRKLDKALNELPKNPAEAN